MEADSDKKGSYKMERVGGSIHPSLRRGVSGSGSSGRNESLSRKSTGKERALGACASIVFF